MRNVIYLERHRLGVQDGGGGLHNTAFNQQANGDEFQDMNGQPQFEVDYIDADNERESSDDVSQLD